MIYNRCEDHRNCDLDVWRVKQDLKSREDDYKYVIKWLEENQNKKKLRYKETGVVDEDSIHDVTEYWKKTIDAWILSQEIRNLYTLRSHHRGRIHEARRRIFIPTNNGTTRSEVITRSISDQDREINPLWIKYRKVK